jgi:hypothetical protein
MFSPMSGGSGKSMGGWTGGADLRSSFARRWAIEVSTAMISGFLREAFGKICS